MFKDLVEKLTTKGVQISERRHRLVCAQSGGENWIGGPSVWTMFHSGRWIIATWTPRIYKLPETASIDLVASAISEILIPDRNDRLYAVPSDLQTKYGLSEIDANAFLKDDELPDELD